MEIKNLGVLIAPPKPTDYIAGTSSPIISDQRILDWSPFLPAFENQRNKVTDFLDCVTMSAIHSLECQLNYMLFSGQLWDEAINFFKDNNYIVNGKFSLSVRFNAKINGTYETKGQYLNVAAASLRASGFVPKSDWDMTDNMSDTLYYTSIPIGLFEKARKSLWFLNIQYQWVRKENFRSLFFSAPVQVATEICPGWDSEKPVQKCSGLPLQHATMVYGNDEVDNWLDFDHYPPYLQKLSHNYEFPVNMQYIVTAKPIALRNGMRGKNVLTLQQNLNKLGFLTKEDGVFGPKTQIQVTSLQNKTGLKSDGIAGSLTLSKLSALLKPKKLVDAIIQVESRGDDMAEGDKNLKNHAYGCLQIRQGVCDAVNNHFRTQYLAQDCLGNRSISLDIWNKYWTIFPDLVTDEDKARAWNGGPYWKGIYALQNKTAVQITYCNNLDIYWNKVQKYL